MDRVLRLDAGHAMAKAVRTDAGFLRVPATVARTGVLTYRFADGSVRRELRLPAEVFHADSLKTLEMVPVTNEHPATASKLLDPETVSKYAVGHVGEKVEQSGDFVAANLMITEGNAIKDVELGKSQVSAGYTTRLEFTPGIHNGQPYDAIQRDIKYNHVAITKVGRAGPDVRLHLDSDGVQVVDKVTEMHKLTINGVDYEVPEQAAQAFKAELSRLGDVATKATAKADSMVAEVERANKARTDAEDPARVRKLVDARIGLERKALAVLGDAAKLEAKTDAEIMAEVVTKINPGMAEKVKGADGAYLAAAFDFAVEGYKPAADATAATRAAGGAVVVQLDSAKIRLEAIQKQNESWRKPLTAKVEGN